MAVTTPKPLQIREAEEEYAAEQLAATAALVLDAELALEGPGSPSTEALEVMPGTRMRQHSRNARGMPLAGGLVLMWKPTPNGYRRRQVPHGNIRMNMRNGWKTACPDCGEVCDEDPNLCPGRPPEERYIECEVPGCNFDRGHAKRIYLRDLPSFRSQPSADDPNRISVGARHLDPVAQLKGALVQHVIRFHPTEAMSQGYITHVPEQAGVLLLDEDPE